MKYKKFILPMLIAVVLVIGAIAFNNGLSTIEDEREMIPLCQDMNIGLTPYSPLAGGRLARDWFGQTKRSQLDQTAKDKYDTNEQKDHSIVDRVGELASKKGVSRAQIALAWLFKQPQVVAPIVGGSKIKYVKEAVQALDVELSNEEIEYLKELYQPHNIVGAL